MQDATVKLRNTFLIVLFALAIVACDGDAADQSWYSTDCTADAAAGFERRCAARRQGLQFAG